MKNKAEKQRIATNLSLYMKIMDTLIEHSRLQSGFLKTL